jgi:hypothetical protein
LGGVYCRAAAGAGPKPAVRSGSQGELSDADAGAYVLDGRLHRVLGRVEDVLLKCAEILERSVKPPDRPRGFELLQ